MTTWSEFTTLDGVIVNRPMSLMPMTGSAPAVCGGLGETLPLELIAAVATGAASNARMTAVTILDEETRARPNIVLQNMV
jgi:hypothetical protein